MLCVWVGVVCVYVSLCPGNVRQIHDLMISYKDSLCSPGETKKKDKRFVSNPMFLIQ